MSIKQKVASCTPYTTQLATFGGANATPVATDAQHDSLKAAADKVLMRNTTRNQRATTLTTTRNCLASKEGEKLRAVPPVISCPATEKLNQVAIENNWPLADLSDWYKGQLDDLGSKSLDGVRFVVRDYIELIELCRGKKYRPIETELQGQY